MCSWLGRSKRIADRFRQAGVNPLRDPVLGTPIDPPLSAGQVEQAAAICEKLAGCGKPSASHERHRRCH